MSFANRPVIGVTGPDQGGLSAWLMTALAIRRAGGRPVRLTPSRSYDENRLDGIVIGGGTDVDPFHYGEEPLPPPQTAEHFSLTDWTVGLLLSALRFLLARHNRGGEMFDRQRDELEQHLVRHALYTDKPLLGICRGAQLINVTLGGSLHQSIDDFYQEGTANPRSILPRKTVTLAEGSCLYELLGGAEARVNALHEQSIRDLGDGLLVSARERNGVIQGIEREGPGFVLGVQWHPEYLPQYPSQQRLFGALVTAARDR
ncbi:gamma-glutamyl-gamma-aminobutyrate hydrolase family protein [Pseudohalioglobus lutimaris]|uniref:Gamma-glutamyl-gamma-aminobutyrate hydrolase n=1 Tax=Pseudohalioglobus lutimaris TaxID=1737061 RepID=A0A2N5X3F1_9GAMM|nr:gamma-glutamyl-gamma-aminobutyrate hydrolase family protein [Pseudohalioglobus lutimaris]PLW69019.1 gamma-glutamyl-gamma-aminobutyrate hydrolase [Pseudohalioglobus lutimaris]